jgi:hypothetical protein
MTDRGSRSCSTPPTPWAASGRNGIPLGEARGDAGGTRLDFRHSSQEAEGAFDAGADAASQCRQVGGALKGGARLRLSKGNDGAVVRTIGRAWARVKFGLVNLPYNIRRLVWLTSEATPV